jgi:3-phenylpropionate/cinnamic acid dioxygenase small subunit
MTTETVQALFLGRRSPWYQEIADLLETEALLLDRRHHDKWLELLSPELSYRCAAVLTLSENASRGYSDSTFHYDESRESLKLRIERLATGSAWAEDPPSRVRRFVTGIQVAAINEADINVSSNVLVTRLRADWSHPHIVTCDRRDVWRRTGEGTWLLHSRDIHLDQTSLATENLSFFL